MEREKKRDFAVFYKLVERKLVQHLTSFDQTDLRPSIPSFQVLDIRVNQGPDDTIMSLVRNCYYHQTLSTIMVHVPPQTPLEDLVMILLSSDEDEGPIPEFSVSNNKPTIVWMMTTCSNC